MSDARRAKRGKAMVETMTAAEREHGRHAEHPGQIPMKGMKDVLLPHLCFADRGSRDAGGSGRDLLPAAGAVSSHGRVVSSMVSWPTRPQLADRILFLAQVMPADGLNIFIDQLKALATERTSALSFGLVFGLLVALWSANNGIKALFEAMNIAYGEEEKRSFFKLNLVSSPLPSARLWRRSLFSWRSALFRP